MDKIYIFLGSCARVGKDTMADLLVEKFQKHGLRAAKFALSEPLKKSCKWFLYDNFNYDVFTEDTKEKSKFRDFLVCVGKMFRESTNGAYFTDILEKKIENSDIQVAIISDLRYADDRWEETDELAFARRKNGFIVHIERVENGIFVPPANDDERIFDEKIKNSANLKIVWDSKNKEEKSKEVFGEILEYFKL